ncbi:hypothetical protein TrispH2_010357 [Trichoplax sp. H2]|nr:hypothetical protein TrispH2_010357 [Trichoplax sp. H2]|eukprot:RDD37268.1 hypothetical protein TrispH2_010357 [Trichoplax sp. H2]
MDTRHGRNRDEKSNENRQQKLLSQSHLTSISNYISPSSDRNQKQFKQENTRGSSTKERTDQHETRHRRDQFNERYSYSGGGRQSEGRYDRGEDPPARQVKLRNSHPRQRKTSTEGRNENFQSDASETRRVMEIRLVRDEQGGKRIVKLYEPEEENSPNDYQREQPKRERRQEISNSDRSNYRYSDRLADEERDYQNYNNNAHRDNNYNHAHRRGKDRGGGRRNDRYRQPNRYKESDRNDGNDYATTQTDRNETDERQNRQEREYQDYDEQQDDNYNYAYRRGRDGGGKGRNDRYRQPNRYKESDRNDGNDYDTTQVDSNETDRRQSRQNRYSNRPYNRGYHQNWNDDRDYSRNDRRDRNWQPRDNNNYNNSYSRNKEWRYHDDERYADQKTADDYDQSTQVEKTPADLAVEETADGRFFFPDSKNKERGGGRPNYRGAPRSQRGGGRGRGRGRGRRGRNQNRPRDQTDNKQDINPDDKNDQDAASPTDKRKQDDDTLNKSDDSGEFPPIFDSNNAPEVGDWADYDQ